MKPFNGSGQVRAISLGKQRAGGEEALQCDPQFGFITMMIHQRSRAMIIVRKGECISQIVGQFAERVVLQDVPTIALLKQSDFSADVRAGIGKIMSGYG